MSVGTKLFTKLKGNKVGKDEYGNVYYCSSAKEGEGIGRRQSERRWVVYKGLAEPSKVPPYWHSWLHHIIDDVPTDEDQKLQYDWQKPHLPNLTGTVHAYNPADVFEDGARPKAIGDYEAWNPNKKS